MTVDLGLFTAAELRAGGINRRGFLQPLLPAPEGVDRGPAEHDAMERLASRGLLRRAPSGWRPVGRFERVLEAAAVARSLVAVWPAHPGAPGFDTPRLALGCLGITNWVLDLRPGPHGYHARLLETAAAALEMAEQVGELAGWTPESPAGDAGEATRLRASVSDADPEWSRIAAQLRRGIASVRIEAASISQPTGPLLQHRLTVVSADDDDWVLLGIREGERGARRAAPATALPMGPILEDLLGGREIR